MKRPDRTKFRIGVAGVYHETNTFAPGGTDINDFKTEWFGNLPFIERYKGTRTSMGGVIDAAAAGGVQLIPGLYTQTTPSGMVTKDTGRSIIESVIGSLDNTQLDGIILILHGAMVSEEFEDMEGVLLKQYREKFGVGFPIATTIDLHANISNDMVNLTDLIIGYDTYPHVDAYERAVEAVELLIKLIESEISPVRAMAKSNMLVVPQTMITNSGPMLDLMKKAFSIEKDPKVLNVTVAGGFPYSDVKDAGMAFVVTTNGDLDLAQHYANELRQLAWQLREQFTVKLLEPEKAIREALKQEDGPVILIEGSDNVGGGSPADATHVLKHLMEAPCSSLVVIRDVDAVSKAHQLGAGSNLECDVGGKSDDLHGEPVNIQGRIRSLTNGEYRHVGSYMTGQIAYMGRTAVVETEHVTLLLTENRVPPWDIGHIQSVGLIPEMFHIILVKAAVAWRTAFGSIAKCEYHVDTPGCCGANLEHFTYKNLNRPIFPLDFS